jgi:hypothetical protein
LSCRYPLNESNEEFAILANGSLLVKGSGIAALLSQDQYCLEYIDAEESTSILICAPEYQIQTAMFVTYVIFTIISTLCFAATFFVYFFWLKIEDVHRKCFTGYVLAMFMTFLSLTIVQTANVEDKGCEVLGGFSRNKNFSYRLFPRFSLPDLDDRLVHLVGNIVL